MTGGNTGPVAVDGPRTALERMQRSTLFATGLAGALFAALLAGGPNGFLAQMDQLRAPFGAFTVVVGVAMPASLTVLARVLSMRALRVWVTVAAAGFLLSQLLWVPFMTVDVLADGAAPWLQGFGGLHATLLAVVWNRGWVWILPALQLPVGATVEYLASGGDLEQSVLDGVGALVTSLILTAAGASVVTAAARQDAEAERAQAEAAIEASLRTGDREQARINALVHDHVISVLLAAVRRPTPEGLEEQAARALDSVATIRESQGRTTAYSPRELEAALRTTVNAVSPDVQMTSLIESERPIPAEVVAALAEAAGEALRNSVLHAGPGVTRSLALEVTDAEARVTVSDNGRGFIPRSVPARRLGLQVSVHGRMRALPGGGAAVTSAPGRGARVALRWRRTEEGR